MKKNILLSIALVIGSFLFASKALAVCPVCVVVVGAGVGLSRYLGVDDVLTGIWVGGLLYSFSIWTINWFNKKNWRFKFRKIIIFAAYYLLTIIPLYYSGIIGHPFNQLWSIDKFVLGIILGTVGVAGGSALYEFLKKKNNGQAHFPFEKVAIPVSALAVLSIIFYFITKA